MDVSGCATVTQDSCSSPPTLLPSQTLLTQICGEAARDDSLVVKSDLCHLHPDQYLKNKYMYQAEYASFSSYISEVIQGLYSFTVFPKLKRQISDSFVHLHKLFPV